MGLKPLNRCCFRFSWRFVFVFFGVLLYVWFSLRFFWFSKNIRENQKTTNPYPRVGLKPLNKCRFGFPEGLFGFLWLSRRFFWFSKNLRENQKTKKKTISKGGSETFKNLVFWFSLSCFWCSLVFFCMFGFLWGVFGFLKKHSGKPTNTYPRVGLKPWNKCCIWFSRRFVFVFFGFLLYVWFYLRIFWFSKNIRENQKNKAISKGGSETFKQIIIGFPEGLFCFLWLSLVCLVFPKLFQGGLDA